MSLPPRQQKVIATILIVGGLILCALGFTGLVPAMRSSGWPSVEGRITGHHFESSTRLKQVTPQFSIALDYRYEVGGKTYFGDTYSHGLTAIGQTHASKKEAEAEYRQSPDFEKWQRGMAVMVFYDPENPSDAVLKPGATGLAWSLTGIGAMITAIGISESRKLKHLPASGNARSDPSA